MSDFNPRTIWQQVCADLELQLTKAVFSTWIVTSALESFVLTGDDEAHAVLICPTGFHATNVQKNFLPYLQASFAKITGKTVTFDLKVGSPIGVGKVTATQESGAVAQPQAEIAALGRD